ncbi:hypothetical protein SLA2020_063480 [Shorea laevis]
MDVFNLIAFMSNCFLIFLNSASASLDSISPSESLPDGQTLVSADGSFELRFFNPGSSRNRQQPINDSSGLLTVKKTGELQLLTQDLAAVWLDNLTREARNPILQLLNSGNLVLIDLSDGISGTYWWQSFDYPSDTLLLGMKMGWDLRTGHEQCLTAWKNSDDPSPGDVSRGIELHGTPELVMRKGSQEYYKAGPYNGQRFSGTEISRPNPVAVAIFVFNEKDLYTSYCLKNKSLISRVFLNQTDYTTQRYIWSEDTQTWNLYSYMPRDFCDT